MRTESQRPRLLGVLVSPPSKVRQGRSIRKPRIRACAKFSFPSVACRLLSPRESKVLPFQHRLCAVNPHADKKTAQGSHQVDTYSCRDTESRRRHKTSSPRMTRSRSSRGRFRKLIQRQGTRVVCVFSHHHDPRCVSAGLGRRDRRDRSALAQPELVLSLGILQ